MGQRVDDHRAQLSTARRRGASEPDIVPLDDSQICLLMAAGFLGDHAGGYRPCNRLADQRAQIVKTRHTQVELSQRKPRTGCQGECPLGMNTLPVGLLRS